MIPDFVVVCMAYSPSVGQEIGARADKRAIGVARADALVIIEPGPEPLGLVAPETKSVLEVEGVGAGKEEPGSGAVLGGKADGDVWVETNSRRKPRDGDVGLESQAEKGNVDSMNVTCREVMTR